MDFIDRIKELANRIPQQLEYCQTEEATKNALVMPFINTLGYDVFNPTEVVPEFTADIGTRRGEKVDYAIVKDGKPIILFECKWSGADLSKEHTSQLFRYFSAVKEVQFGVLTNGVIYQFYSDLDAPNRMDDKPFFVFNILDFQDRHINELKKFTKSTFDLDEIRATASDLKYTAAIGRIINEEFDQPSDDFVSFFAKKVYSGRMTQSAREQFSEITQKALRRFLNDKINDRLKSAIEESPKLEEVSLKPSSENIEEELDDSVVRQDKKRGIFTTEEEIEAYFVAKSILRDSINPKRIKMRDTKSYCGILLDDNNRKPICRLHFNRGQKYIGLFGEDREEVKIPIDDIDDIYQYADKIITTVKFYDTQFGIPTITESEPPGPATTKGKDGTYTGKQIQAIIFQGKRQEVDSWRNAMFAILEILRSQNPQKFSSVSPTMVGRKRPHITPNESELRHAQLIPQTDLFVEINLSSQMIVKLCYGLLEKMGYLSNDLFFEVS